MSVERRNTFRQRDALPLEDIVGQNAYQKFESLNFGAKREHGLALVEIGNELSQLKAELGRLERGFDDDAGLFDLAKAFETGDGAAAQIRRHVVRFFVVEIFDLGAQIGLV